MKVLVPVKRVVDYNVKVRVKADGTDVDLANVKMSMIGAFWLRAMMNCSHWL